MNNLGNLLVRRRRRSGGERPKRSRSGRKVRGISDCGRESDTCDGHALPSGHSWQSRRCRLSGMACRSRLNESGINIHSAYGLFNVNNFRRSLMNGTPGVRRRRRWSDRRNRCSRLRRMADSGGSVFSVQCSVCGLLTMGLLISRIEILTVGIWTILPNRLRCRSAGGLVVDRGVSVRSSGLSRFAFDIACKWTLLWVSRPHRLKAERRARRRTAA